MKMGKVRCLSKTSSFCVVLLFTQHLACQFCGGSRLDDIVLYDIVILTGTLLRCWGLERSWLSIEVFFSVR